MMDYKNLLWPQWRTALPQLAVYRRMFWTDYLIVLATNLCRMLTIETTMMLANLATKPEAKRILTAEVFLMATRTSVMMNVMVQTLRMSCALNYQCWMMRSFIFVRRKRCLRIANIQMKIFVIYI